MYEYIPVVQVYCDMEGMKCDGKGGWTRVAYINITQSGATCPTGLSINHNLCGKPSYEPHCVSTVFSSHNITYSKVCGQLRGYQYGRINGLHYIAHGIESHYVDGVSITHGSNPRKHIWTYVGGRFEDEHSSAGGCPCSTGYTGGNTSFIGSHYYCESGTSSRPSNIIYPNDPLWDGQQCNGREAPCCPANSTMPWFYRSLDTNTTDDIELRVCAYGSHGPDQTLLEIIELYIK